MRLTVDTTLSWKLTPDESLLPFRSVVWPFVTNRELCLWFVMNMSSATLPVSVCPPSTCFPLKMHLSWRGGLFHTNTPWVVLFRILIALSSSTLKMLYLHSLVIKRICISSLAGIWIVLLIYLNVTLGTKCTIIHVLHNKIALYGKCIYNVCFAKTSECCNLQVSVLWTCLYIFIGTNSELS